MKEKRGIFPLQSVPSMFATDEATALDVGQKCRINACHHQKAGKQARGAPASLNAHGVFQKGPFHLMSGSCGPNGQITHTK